MLSTSRLNGQRIGWIFTEKLWHLLDTEQSRPAHEPVKVFSSSKSSEDSSVHLLSPSATRGKIDFFLLSFPVNGSRNLIATEHESIPLPDEVQNWVFRSVICCELYAWLLARATGTSCVMKGRFAAPVYVRYIGLSIARKRCCTL